MTAATPPATTEECPAHYCFQPGDDDFPFPPAAYVVTNRKLEDMARIVSRAAAAWAGLVALRGHGAKEDAEEMLYLLGDLIEELEEVTARGVSWKAPATGEEA